jgi:hypothetical protein
MSEEEEEKPPGVSEEKEEPSAGIEEEEEEPSTTFPPSRPMKAPLGAREEERHGGG